MNTWKAKTISGEQKIPILVHFFSLTHTFFFFSPIFPGPFWWPFFWARKRYLDRKANWTNPGREDGCGLGDKNQGKMLSFKSLCVIADHIFVTLSISIAKSCDLMSKFLNFAFAGVFTSEVGLSWFGWLSLFNLAYMEYLYINERYLCHIWIARHEEHICSQEYTG